jgi:hypothetical protein
MAENRTINQADSNRDQLDSRLLQNSGDNNAAGSADKAGALREARRNAESNNDYGSEASAPSLREEVLKSKRQRGAQAQEKKGGGADSKKRNAHK